MATLYVENVPDELYEALRARAREHRKSITAEVLTLLEDNVPTAQDLRRRREFLKRVRQIQSRSSKAGGPFPTAQQMLREDRER